MSAAHQSFYEETLAAAKRDDFFATFDLAVIHSQRVEVGRAIVLYAKFLLQAQLEFYGRKPVRYSADDVNIRLKRAAEYLLNIIRDEPHEYKTTSAKRKKYLGNVIGIIAGLKKIPQSKQAAFLKAILKKMEVTVAQCVKFGRRAIYRSDVHSVNIHVIFLALLDRDQRDFYKEKIKKIFFVSEAEERAAILIGSALGRALDPHKPISAINFQIVPNQTCLNIVVNKERCIANVLALANGNVDSISFDLSGEIIAAVPAATAPGVFVTTGTSVNTFLNELKSSSHARSSDDKKVESERRKFFSSSVEMGMLFEVSKSKEKDFSAVSSEIELQAIVRP